ncbi:hypothetical protein EW146_g1293 [Bondarzewia mesenterica]|uniref:Proteasome assembly chaperone 2 n=1 Tax=Bondarzewia mesenterica TaxID=1095465 RepID=A0A4S4M466_9AGAM|nr:hypothetical protein EW146_g1293 [Bondarzewia mesenterica]
MSFYYPRPSSLNIAGKSVVIPIVSTANVSQLAVDLLIASLSLRCIGAFDPQYLVPVVGAREDGEKGVTTPLELYGREGVNVVVMQQRSPVLKSRKQDFIDALLSFIRESQCAAALFLSGVDLSNRTDAQMFTPTYHIRPSTSPSWTSTPLQSLASLPIPKYTSPVSQHPLAAQLESSVPFIPGGGLTRRIVTSIPPAWPVPTVSLLQFVIEGDNRADASMLAAVVAKVLSVDMLIGTWKQPSSWQQGLFGTPQDQTLFGTPTHAFQNSRGRLTTEVYATVFLGNILPPSPPPCSFEFNRHDHIFSSFNPIIMNMSPTAAIDEVVKAPSRVDSLSTISLVMYKPNLAKSTPSLAPSPPLFHDTIYAPLCLPWPQILLESHDVNDFLSFVQHIDAVTEEARTHDARAAVHPDEHGRTRNAALGVYGAFVHNVPDIQQCQYERPAMVIGGAACAGQLCTGSASCFGASVVYLVNRYENEVDAVIDGSAKVWFKGRLLRVGDFPPRTEEEVQARAIVVEF